MQYIIRLNTIRCWLEFKINDMWIFIYWKSDICGGGTSCKVNIWVCLLPTIPIHIIFERTRFYFFGRKI